MNKIMLIGNLGREPELNYTPGGQAITKFSLAVNRRTKDRETGERREETTWFYIVAWEHLAEICNQFLHKGSKVFLEGRMTSRKYTNRDGVEVTAWEVVISDMEMLDSRADAEQRSGTTAPIGGETDPDEVPF